MPRERLTTKETVRHIALTCSPAFMAILDRHRLARPDQPSLAAMMREYTLKVIEWIDREQRVKDHEERKRLAREQRAAKSVRTIAQQRDRLDRVAQRRAERASQPGWQ